MSRANLWAAVAVLGAGLLPTCAVAAATATMSASPNPCVIQHGSSVCTSYITWSSQGAKAVRVYVIDEGKKAGTEREFGTTPSCEGTRCRAPWIEKNTTYVFTLYDYSSGNRGPVLSSVKVTGTMPSGGTISANPNPCVVGKGASTCTTYLTWSTESVKAARVYVTDQNSKGKTEQEFGTTTSCEGTRCKAPWIEHGTTYTFTLYDYSSGQRGTALGAVTVTGKQ